MIGGVVELSVLSNSVSIEQNSVGNLSVILSVILSNLSVVLSDIACPLSVSLSVLSMVSVNNSLREFL